LTYDTAASCVTDNCPLVASRERGDGNLPRDGLISQLTRHTATYILYWQMKRLHNAICDYVVSLAVSTALWPLSMYIQPDRTT